MNERIEKVKELALALRALIPEGNSVGIEFTDYQPDAPVELSIHGIKSYEEGTAVMRSLGIGERHKKPYCADLIFTTLKGEIGGVQVTAFCDGLPPSCRLEKTKELIPKTQTVESGDFVEVERLKVVCGNGH